MDPLQRRGLQKKWDHVGPARKKLRKPMIDALHMKEKYNKVPHLDHKAATTNQTAKKKCTRSTPRRAHPP
jgi:hypothetical protein